MIIKNLTSKELILHLESFVGGSIYDVYVQPDGICDVEGMLLTNGEELKGKIKIISSSVEDTTIVIEEDTIPEDDDDGEEKEEESEETSDVGAKCITEDKFICDICHSEFASARGLAAHKSRVHNE